MARPRQIPGVTADSSYASAAARVVEVRAQELMDHSRGVLDLKNIEPVHDMRVATRRLRSALEVFQPCFPRDELKDVLAEVKAIAGALGERRDRDVAIGALEGFAGSLAVPDRRGVESLVEELRAEQVRANEELVPFVEPARLERLHDRLKRLVADAERMQ